MAGGFDTSGFILPDNKFAGLKDAASELTLQNRYKGLAQQRQATQKLLADKYVGNEFKSMFTGTPYDGIYNQMIPNVKDQMEKLIEGGADLNEAQMAMYPQIQQMADYQTNAKDFQLKNTQAQTLISKRPDINKDEFNKEVLSNAFPIDPNTGQPDVTQYDPNKNYWDDAINNGTSVLNNTGVKSWFQSFKPTADNNSYKYTTSNGTSTYSKNALSYPSFMQPVEDPVKGFQGFEPKHQIATDDGNTVLHQFGEQTGQPVKLLDQDVWDAMPAENKQYYVQQVRNHIAQTDSKTQLDGQAAENYARALAYDDANTFGQSNTKSNFNNQTNNFDKYAFADYNNRLRKNLFDYQSSGGDGSSRLNQGNVLDLFGVDSPLPLQSGGQVLNGKVYDASGNVQKGGQIVVDKQHLPAEFTNVIQTGAKQGVPKFITFDVGADGTLQAAHLPTGIANRDQINDFQSQIQTKGKVAPKKTFGQNAPTQAPDNTTYKVKGKTYTHADLNKMGYTDDQIKTAKANGTIR